MEILMSSSYIKKRLAFNKNLSACIFNNKLLVKILVTGYYHLRIFWWKEGITWWRSLSICLLGIQRKPSCEATPFASEQWPFKRGGLSSGVEINTFMLRFILSSGLSRGVGLSPGWPLKRGSTVSLLDHWC